MRASPKKDNIKLDPKFTALARPAYYQELVYQIARTKPGERVLIATMSFKPEKLDIQPILDELNAAAHRNVNVHLIVDAYAFLVGYHDTPGPLVFSKKLSMKHMPQPFRTRLEALEALRENGGNYTIINRPPKRLSNPLAGRSHMKLAVINDLIYIGGCNLSTVDHLDLMIRWQDRSTADWLEKLMNEVINTGSVRQPLAQKDLTRNINDHTTLLIDCGKPKQSRIFDTALDLIDQAQTHIILTSQYFPNNSIAQHLAGASSRGVRVSVIYNNPSRHDFPYKPLMRGVLWRERRRLPAAFFEHELPKDHDYLHAKLLVTDQGVIIGSHNFVPTGVRFGTAEIALITTDTDFIRQVSDTLKRQLTINQELF